MIKAAYFARHKQLTRSISNNPRIIKSQLLRKIDKKVDRLPSQGVDPASAYKKGWRLACATMLERYPTITPDIHPFENEYLEGRFLDEQLRSCPMPAEAFLSERDQVDGKKYPTFDDPIANQYVPASRVTEADHKNDIRSLDRALQERLYFVIKSAHSSLYRLPQIMVDDDEVKLITFAERAFKAVTNPVTRPHIHYIAPRPACHLEHVYPVSYQKKYDVYGIRIFFYRAMLVVGEIDGVKNADDFAWARASELNQFLGPEYHAAMKPALLGNGPSIDFEV